MLTFCTVPRPMTGRQKMIQYNAIRSWQQTLGCIMLLGDEPGVREAAKELNVEHVGGLELNDHGTPLISSLVEKINEHCEGTACFISTDEIIMPGFEAAIHDAAEIGEKYLLVGQRWEGFEPYEINYSLGWPIPFYRFIRGEKARRSNLTAVDYLIFPAGMIDHREVPPLAVGRPRCDNWFISYAKNNRIPIVDITHDVNIVHQNHDYAHVKKGNGVNADGPESLINQALYGYHQRVYGVESSSYRLIEGRLYPNFNFDLLRSRVCEKLGVYIY